MVPAVDGSGPNGWKPGAWGPTILASCVQSCLFYFFNILFEIIIFLLLFFFNPH